MVRHSLFKKFISKFNLLVILLKEKVLGAFCIVSLRQAHSEALPRYFCWPLHLRSHSSLFPSSFLPKSKIWLSCSPLILLAFYMCVIQLSKLSLSNVNRNTLTESVSQILVSFEDCSPKVVWYNPQLDGWFNHRDCELGSSILHVLKTFLLLLPILICLLPRPLFLDSLAILLPEAY